MIAAAALVGAATLGGRRQMAGSVRTGRSCSALRVSGRCSCALATPAVYVVLLAIFERLAGPSWAGLLSTFPSLSLVVLVVTYLEAGPAESSRVAQVLPCGNSSTLAFLAVFRLVGGEAGVGWADLPGYIAAVSALVVIQQSSAWFDSVRAIASHMTPSRGLGRIVWPSAAERPPGRGGCTCGCRNGCSRAGPRLSSTTTGPASGFAPLVETLAW